MTTDETTTETDALAELLAQDERDRARHAAAYTLGVDALARNKRPDRAFADAKAYLAVSPERLTADVDRQKKYLMAVAKIATEAETTRLAGVATVKLERHDAETERMNKERAAARVPLAAEIDRLNAQLSLAMDARAEVYRCGPAHLLDTIKQLRAKAESVAKDRDTVQARLDRAKAQAAGLRGDGSKSVHPGDLKDADACDRRAALHAAEVKELTARYDALDAEARQAEAKLFGLA